MLNSLLVLTLASHNLWPNSTENVHTFLTFDSGVPLAAINASALAQLDFVSAAKISFLFWCLFLSFLQLTYNTCNTANT